MNIHCRCLLMWVACLLLLASPSLLASQPAVAGNTLFSYHFSEPAVVFHNADLLNDHLPRLIQTQGFPAVFSNELNLRCLSLRGRKSAVLVYLPQSQTCMALDDLRRSQGHEQTAGMNWNPGFETEYQQLQTRLQSEPLVIIQPQVLAVAAAGMCSCAGNVSPIVVVDAGLELTVNPGDPVAITYSATDEDSEVLTEYFSYRLDGGSSQEGLPSGLVENCSKTTGTLGCSITGSAPLLNGYYAIRLQVSDGLSSGFATAFLTVLPDIILLDGFESNP